jgi:hypothetical protein
MHECNRPDAASVDPRPQRGAASGELVADAVLESDACVVVVVSGNTGLPLPDYTH